MIMRIGKRGKALVAALCVLAVGAAVAADDSPSDMHHAPPSKQDREQMAKLHEHMAACLRSDKTMRDCHEAVRKECQDTMGDKCEMMMHPMMEHHMNKQRENGGTEPHEHQ
jgi:hypothetical protein